MSLFCINERTLSLRQVIGLEESICQQIHLAGGKAAQLAKLTNQFRIAPGFVIAQQYVTQSAIRDVYDRLGFLGKARPGQSRAFAC